MLIHPNALLAIVDDDEDDRFLLQTLFVQQNNRLAIQVFPHGEAFLDYLSKPFRTHGQASHSPYPALVLMDLNMPRKNGFQTLAELKANPHTASIPVIILSTSASEKDILHAHQNGATDYLTKPSDLEAIEAMVRSLYGCWLARLCPQPHAL